jgi:hypothetical protein
MYWLPTHASWLDQVEIIFSKVQRDLLTPNDFPSTLALEKQLKTEWRCLKQPVRFLNVFSPWDVAP